ncbi:MAG: TrkH family potassium uptake protein [Limnochordia bacterium]|mgnify:FL=1
MNFGMVGRILGTLLLIEALILAVPLLVSVVYGETAASAFAWSIVITAAAGLVLTRIKPGSDTIKAREGLLIVTLGWAAAAVFGALPFFFARAVPTFIDALFECTSGLTTTGATIINDPEALPRGILFWRSFSHWLGGMGILVFTLALLPAIGVGGMQIYKAEAPGPSADKLVPRLANTAQLLYTVYLGLTVLAVLALVCAGVPLFDAVLLGFGAVGTGGFTPYSTPIGSVGGSAVPWALAVLMILAGVNFSLYYELWRRRWSSLGSNSELKVYLGITVLSAALVTMNLVRSLQYGWGDAAKHALFQVSSIITTTGYSTADYSQWPEFSKAVLFMLLFVGGSAGSTAGGIKVIRLMVAAKLVGREVRRMLHSQALVPVTINGRVVPQETVASIASFVFLYLGLFVAGTLLVALAGTDLFTSASAAAATLGNVGVGFGLVGPGNSFSFFSGPVKLLLTVLMLVGRLEMFTVLVIFTPGFWRQA